MQKKIKIVIADDELLFRSGISFLLQREDNIEILFEADNGLDVVEFLKKNSDNLPDIILMDLKMPIQNGVETTKIIHKYYPEIKIIALTSYNTSSFINNMIQLGASSYLVKNTSPTEMVLTINEVYKKGFYYNEAILKVIQANIKFNQNKLKNSFDEDYLSEREKEILQLICQQYSTPEIAEKLFISPRTVDGHRNNLLLKTESKNVAGLVVYALQKQIVHINP